MKRFIFILLILSVAVSFLDSREISPDGDGLNFEIEFKKDGILRYGFGIDENTPGDSYITFPSAARGETIASDLYFYYFNTFEGNHDLSVIFDCNDTYDYLSTPSGYMLMHERGEIGLNYNVTITGTDENGMALGSNTITVQDSGEALSTNERTVHITESGSYKIQMTMNPPEGQDYYSPGRYTGFVLLIYTPAD